MLLRELVQEDIESEKELQALVLSCLYLSYRWIFSSILSSLPSHSSRCSLGSQVLFLGLSLLSLPLLLPLLPFFNSFLSNFAAFLSPFISYLPPLFFPFDSFSHFVTLYRDTDSERGCFCRPLLLCFCTRYNFNSIFVCTWCYSQVLILSSAVYK